ncbi:hypothetical protein [Pseudomonas sp. HMSC08G10]|uniref:hypothetical protein n=1 Tax=Pseudomonas sp. HMSC08G10 TaxID=1581141 RepID=UPI001113066C|nr:hypothetical protein [Pseudomonas sp. HMSC08G10]
MQPGATRFLIGVGATRPTASWVAEKCTFLVLFLMKNPVFETKRRKEAILSENAGVGATCK